MWNIYDISYYTANVDEIKEWSSQQIFQFKQLEGLEAWKMSGLQWDSKVKYL